LGSCGSASSALAGSHGARDGGQSRHGAIGRNRHQAPVTLTFALGATRGLGGGLGAEIIAIQPSIVRKPRVFLWSWSRWGLDSLRGPFVAALLIGTADTACKYWLPQYGAFPIYVATIAVLLWRPAGLFGRHA